jgi:hypothetical protein
MTPKVVEPGEPFLHETMKLRAVLLLIGFPAIVSQIVLMRESLVVFNGNEKSPELSLARCLCRRCSC